MDVIETAYRMLLWLSTTVLSVLAFACLIRGILGPRLTDRIISISVICTKVVILIAVLSVLMDDSSLLDVSIVYAMIGFLAVVVLSKTYLLPTKNVPADIDYDPEDGSMGHGHREEVVS